MSAGENAVNPLVYGEFTHPFVLAKDQVIEIVVNNLGILTHLDIFKSSTYNGLDSGKHPFHLHGHNFQAIVRSDEEAGVFDATNSSQTQYPAIPMRRDTLVLHPNGHMVMRFKADNPGVWLFHCQYVILSPPSLSSCLLSCGLRPMLTIIQHRMAHGARSDCNNGRGSPGNTEGHHHPR